MKRNMFIVINKEDNTEESFNNKGEARAHLTRLVCAGIAAYIVVVPILSLFGATPSSIR